MIEVRELQAADSLDEMLALSREFLTDYQDYYRAAGLTPLHTNFLGDVEQAV